MHSALVASIQSTSPLRAGAAQCGHLLGKRPREVDAMSRGAPNAFTGSPNSFCSASAEDAQPFPRAV